MKRKHVSVLALLGLYGLFAGYWAQRLFDGDRVRESLHWLSCFHRQVIVCSIQQGAEAWML